MKSMFFSKTQMGNNGLRLDASFHLSDGASTRRALARIPYRRIPIGQTLSRSFYGGRDKRVYVNSPDHGIPFLGGSTMLKADLSGVKLISKKKTPNIENTILDSGWILVSRSGTVGKCVFSCGIHKGFAASEHVIRLVPNGTMPAGVIYSFLASKYGYALMTQGMFGSVIQEVEPEYIESLEIPVFPEELQKKVHALITESAKLREEADAARAKALKFFDNFTIQEQEKIFSKKLSRLQFSWAAYNNNLNVDVIKEKYSDQKVSLDKLTDRIFAPPLFKHIYLSSDNGYPFLTGKEVTYQNQRYYRWLSPRGVRDINDYIVKKGTLLIYKSGTTDGGILGYVTIVDDNLDGACLSDHVIRLNFKSFSDACWAYSFLKSKSGETLLQALATGTMIPFITPERLKTLEIPAPDIHKDEISVLIEEYLTKKSSGNNKENEAIRLIEEEIEKWQR